MNIDIRYP
jgi:hypothetical protein